MTIDPQEVTALIIGGAILGHRIVPGENAKLTVATLTFIFALGLIIFGVIMALMDQPV